MNKVKPSPEHKGTSLCTCVVKAGPRLVQDSTGVTLYTAAPATLSQSLPPRPPTAVTSQHFSPLKGQDVTGPMKSSPAGLIKCPFVCIIAVSNASLGRNGPDGETQRGCRERSSLSIYKEEMLFPTCVSLFSAPGVHFYTSNKPWDFSRPRSSLAKNGSLWSAGSTAAAAAMVRGYVLE